MENKNYWIDKNIYWHGGATIYTIDKKNNEIQEVTQKNFSELGFNERDHLQEWIDKNPSCLGEDLLIIQKEFHDFDDTNERLDLLALDKMGNLVIIENKLDDTGKDVIWQVLKYASYCSSLSKNQIICIYQDFLKKKSKDADAKGNILSFLGIKEIEEMEFNMPQSQRIFLVAANFRKEVTSAALWLRGYSLDVKCLKATPYQIDNRLLLNFEQIIPLKETEEYIIKMTEKNQEILNEKIMMNKRKELHKEFWSEFLNRINKKHALYNGISPSDDYWLSKSAGITGLHYNVSIGNKFARVELYLDINKECNKKMYDLLYEEKEVIESELGYELIWERLDEKNASRIKYESTDTCISNKEEWEIIIAFLIENVVKFEETFKKRIPDLRKALII